MLAVRRHRDEENFDGVDETQIVELGAAALVAHPPLNGDDRAQSSRQASRRSPCQRSGCACTISVSTVRPTLPFFPRSRPSVHPLRCVRRHDVTALASWSRVDDGDGQTGWLQLAARWESPRRCCLNVALAYHRIEIRRTNSTRLLSSRRLSLSQGRRCACAAALRCATLRVSCGRSLARVGMVVGRLPPSPFVHPSIHPRTCMAVQCP